MAQKMHMHWRQKYYINLFCESKLLTEVDPKKKIKFHHINKLEKYKLDRQPFTSIKLVKQC